MTALSLPLAAILLRWVPFFGQVRSIQFLAMLGVLIFTAITSAIIGYHMRREIRKSLGRKATDEDLSDVETWMEVRDAEEKAGGKNTPGAK